MLKKTLRREAVVALIAMLGMANAKLFLLTPAADLHSYAAVYSTLA
jgi:hypothetical protein